jgi:peptidoglycan/LPS O-acetylase OafA/YrhL
MQSADYRANWLWYVFYFSNYKPAYANDPYLGQFWSLAVEEQFYLTWPLTVYLLSKKKLALLCSVVAFVSLLLRYWLDGTGWNAYALTFTRLDPLALGALFALAFRTPRWRELSERYASKLSWVAFVAFLISVLAN